MLNAKAFELTETEKARLVESARLSVKAHDMPHVIFFDSSGSVHIEQWRGEKFGGGVLYVVLPAWAKTV